MGSREKTGRSLFSRGVCWVSLQRWWEDGGYVTSLELREVRLEAKAQQLRLQNLPLPQAGLSNPLSVDF